MKEAFFFVYKLFSYFLLKMCLPVKKSNAARMLSVVSMVLLGLCWVVVGVWVVARVFLGVVDNCWFTVEGC